MDAKQKKRLSKFLTLILRHKPEKAGITIDKRGFCKIQEILEKANQFLAWKITREDLENLATPSENPMEKVRFEIEGDYIRAGHGHSIVIEGYRETTPEEKLYHASTKDCEKAIRESGLKAMGRQKVHLSYDKDITIEAARRKRSGVILIVIDAKKATERGILFYESADKRIILSDDIPADCIEILDL